MKILILLILFISHSVTTLDHWLINIHNQANKAKQSITIIPAPTKKKVNTKTQKRVIVSKDCSAFQNYSNNNILCIVQGLESTWGKNDSCQNKGKVNTFGYVSNKVCFDSLDDAAKKVDQWFTDRSNLSLVDKLCIYNLGDRGWAAQKKRGIRECKYYKNAMRLGVPTGSGTLLP